MSDDAVNDNYRPSGKRRRGAKKAGKLCKAENLWDSDLVNGAAFCPRTCEPSTTYSAAVGGWVDGDIPLDDEGRLAYRLYLAPVATDGLQRQEGCILIYFHANAELLTDIEDEVAAFHACGVEALFCPEYRGYAWSTGSPALSCLCPDAELAFRALPDVLVRSGAEHLAGAPVVVHGRSLGASCAVHLASKAIGSQICGLIVESGCMSMTELPMVTRLGAFMPHLLLRLRLDPEPLQTMQKLRDVSLPTLLIHGSRDEIVPVQQAVAAHDLCASNAKRLTLLSRAHHNDVRTVAETEYFDELRLLISVALGETPREALNEPRCTSSEISVVAAISRALLCIPGMNRCLRL